MKDEGEMSGSNSSAEELKPIKVLLADDDQEDQELFQDALEKTGTNAEVTIVNNGQELLENLKDTEQPTPDIIFLDTNMPVIDGRKALQEIKKDETLKDIPTVVLSTSDNPTEIQESFRSGADLYVQKPNTFRNFVFILRKVLSFHWAGTLLKSAWSRFFITERNISGKDF